jgi:DMSO/TMAO reductase YedYZ molybdopterin-dependent catalytic subunit
MEIPGSYRWPSRSPGDGGRPSRLTRRTLLASSLAGLLNAQKSEISSFDLSLVDGLTVPNELFFVRDHFPAPAVSAAGWKLSIGGAVAAPVEMSLEDIESAPHATLGATIECAENPVGGGLVSHAGWTGVTLASLLEKVRARPEARLVRLTGADGYYREIPLVKAAPSSTRLAFQMNGEKLSPAHGFPLRALVPGWYAMDSVKWLRRIDLREDEDSTMPAAFRYRRQVRSLLVGAREADPVTAMNVKSAFSRPLDGAVLIGRKFIIRGVAWAGEHRVVKQEVSTDAGKTWRPAAISSKSEPYAWVQWQYAWTIPKAGDYQLLARAADDAGRVQPLNRAADRADPYELNSCQSVQVRVL